MSKPLKNGQKFPAQFRSSTIHIRSAEGDADRAGADLDAEKGIVRNVTVSSEEPYSRFFGTEILSHNEKAVNLARMKKGATPLLFNHNRDELIGKSMNPRLEGGKLLVDFKFSSSDRAQQMLTDLRDGILTECSIGYSVDKFEVEEKTDTYTATRWTLFECSLVSVPADFTVGVGRAEETQTELTVETVDNPANANRNTMADTVTTPTAPEVKIDVNKERNEAVTTERKRVADIQELSRHFATNGLGGRKIDTSELADKYIKGEQTARDFQDAVVRGNFKEPVQIKTEAEEVGMNDRETKSFSFLRAIYGLGTGRGLTGLEKEASDAHAKMVGRECGPNSFYVPVDVQRASAFPRGISEAQVRALFSNLYSGAGAFVGTELLGGSLIDLLRNQMLVVQMGARNMSGLVGNVAIPRQTGGATASWLAEDSTITATQQTVGQLNLTPHKLAAATAFTEQFAIQTSVDAENFVRQDLMAVTAIARDLAAIAGTGVSGQPVGILNLGSTNLSTSVTLSAAQSMTYANAVQFELNVALNNANKGKLGYMTSPTVKNNAKLIAEISSTNSNPVWKDDRVNGYAALATNQIPTATSVIFGNWDDLILADWATSNFFVDPYSLSLQGQIRVINRLYCDNGVRHGTSFAVSTN